MRYRFNDFEFDSDKLILTQEGVAVALRHTEASVLAILLKHKDTVLNKEAILTLGWQGKIVSDQVVFQNISHLRALFGNKAIKTFPKRGYQWQLPTEPISEAHFNGEIHDKVIASKLSSNDTSTHQGQPQNSLVHSRAVAAGFAFTLLATFAIYNFVYKDQTNVVTKNVQQESHNKVAQAKVAQAKSKVKIAYIPIKEISTSLDSKLNDLDLPDISEIEFTQLSHFNTDAYEQSIITEYPKLSTNHPFVLSGKYRQYNSKYYLDFTLSGPFDTWQGQISADSPEEVSQQLVTHLEHDVIYDLLEQPQPPGIKLAKLAIAHQESPKDLIVLRELSIVYFLTNQLDKAMAMTDKLITLAKTQDNQLQIGRALAYQSKILTRKGLYDLSTKKISAALEQFEQINDLKYQARAWYYQSWIDDKLNNYQAINESLLTSIRFAFEAKNTLGEVETLIHLAKMAHTYQQHQDKYRYLQQAEDKITAYQLPNYHLAKVSYRYASFANTFSEKEPHLKQALLLASTSPEHWVAQSAKRQLVKGYITQARLDETQALIRDTQVDNANNAYLRTLLAQAQQNTTELINQAQRTFKHAQFSGNQSLGLEAALLLSLHNINSDFYSQYINDNAPDYWRLANKVELETLNL